MSGDSSGCADSESGYPKSCFAKLVTVEEEGAAEIGPSRLIFGDGWTQCYLKFHGVAAWGC